MSTERFKDRNIEVDLPGITSLIQKLRHLSGLSTSRLSTDDDTGVLSHCLHDDLLLCQHGQLQTSFLQQQIEIHLKPNLKKRTPKNNVITVVSDLVNYSLKHTQ